MESGSNVHLNVDDEPMGSNDPTPSSGTTGGRKTNIKAKTSIAWSIFEHKTMMYEGTMQKRAVCKNCGKNYKDSLNGTSHLMSHYRKCSQLHSSPNDPRQSQLNFSNPGGALTTFSYDPERTREGIALYTASAEQPYNFGADPKFERLVKTCFNPQFQKVSRNTIVSDTTKLFKRMKKDLIQYFSTSNLTIACTSDMWEGLNRVGFFCLTAHYVDQDWLLNKRIIAFRMLEHPHNASAIFSSIMEVFRQYGIEDKIFNMTFDNHSANTASIPMFARALHSPYRGANNLFHVRCVCHIINLVVQDGLKHVNFAIEKIRFAVLYIASSTSRVQEFKRKCRAYGLKTRKFVTDTENRWNTTFLMLDSCTGYENCISDYIFSKLLSQPQHHIMDEDWEVSNRVMEFLRVFYHATVACSGVYYSTSNIVLNYIQQIFEIFQNYKDDELFENAIPAMVEKIVKYWGEMPQLFILAACMDPRQKIIVVEECLESIKSFLGDAFRTDIYGIKNNLVEMYGVYNAKYGASSGTTVGSSSTTASSSSSSSKLPKMLPMFMRTSSTRRARNEVDSELERYLNTEFFGGNFSFEAKLNLNVLEWWKGQQNYFPVLSIMARDLLTPPVSTVASESAFSAGKRVLSERRTRLTPSNLESLMCVRDWDNAAQRIQDQVPDEIDFAADFANLGVNDDVEAEVEIEDDEED